MFSQEAYKSKGANFTISSVAMSLLKFQEQLHYIHWNTKSYSEHKFTGKLYEYLQSFRDDVVEKMAGYCNERPFPPPSISIGQVNIPTVLGELMEFSRDLELYAESKGYSDIANLASELSGEVAKAKYLSTLK